MLNVVFFIVPEACMLMRDDNQNIGIICLDIVLPDKMLFLTHHFESFEDEFEYISRVLSITDKMLFLIISTNFAEGVVSFIHRHLCVEEIFLYGSMHDESSLDWITQYVKIRGHW